jgi:deoxyribonuclease-4
LSLQNINEFKKNCEKYGFESEHILAHDSYLINLGNPDQDKRDKSFQAFLDEFLRSSELGIKYLNFHPGNHLGGLTEEKCLDFIAQAINKILALTQNVTAVIENTAGQGTSVGYKFEHLAYLIDKTEDKSRIGICLDTCHLFASGYDLRTQDTYKKTMLAFEKTVGFSYLKGMHLNDSKAEFGSRKDRHHSLGQGELGLAPFRFIMQDKRMDGIPLILETIDETKWAEEIRLLASFEEDRTRS